ncbi:4'-phosphopantetheinyl transferase family protein [Streptomyces sp. NPDC058674]|uniref:4'-phosphopantetheinyl transferase family protein n=1 Tax=Streptomyces sp. NPDC058674 TaxID=3346592 RepID=UPI003649D033
MTPTRSDPLEERPAHGATGRPPAGPVAPPLHVPGPEGPWDEVGDLLDDTGRALVCTTWGQWLTAVLLDPELRPLLGEDWPRYRRTPAAAERLAFAVSRALVKYTAATALHVPAHTLDIGYDGTGRPLLRGAGSGLEMSLARTGELIVVGVSRTGPIGVHAEPADTGPDTGPDGGPDGGPDTGAGTGGGEAGGRGGARPGALAQGLVEDTRTAGGDTAPAAAPPEAERRARALARRTLQEARARTPRHRPPAAPGPADGPAGPGPRGGAGAAGEWSVGAHLVQGRYLVAAAHLHRPAPAPAGADAVRVDTGSRSGAGPLEETGPRTRGELRFLRPVTSGRGEGRRTP